VIGVFHGIFIIGFDRKRIAEDKVFVSISGMTCTATLFFQLPLMQTMIKYHMRPLKHAKDFCVADDQFVPVLHFQILPICG